MSSKIMYQRYAERQVSGERIYTARLEFVLAKRKLMISKCSAAQETHLSVPSTPGSSEGPARASRHIAHSHCRECYGKAVHGSNREVSLLQMVQEDFWRD